MAIGIRIIICSVVVACSCSPAGVEPGPIYLDAPLASLPAPVRRTALGRGFAASDAVWAFLSRQRAPLLEP